jgi:hypothetical protein
MNGNTRRVLNGWLNLTITERLDFMTASREYSESSENGKRAITENTRDAVMKMDTGPLGSTCRCCGR